MIYLRVLRVSTIAPALFSALTPVSPYLLHPCSRTYGHPALVRGEVFLNDVTNHNILVLKYHMMTRIYLYTLRAWLIYHLERTEYSL